MKLVNRNEVLLFNYQDDDRRFGQPAWVIFFNLVDVKEGCIHDWFRIKWTMESVRNNLEARDWFMS